MATPNYQIVTPDSYGGILAGAATALSGIAQEAKAAEKAKQTYMGFADTLESQGLVGDAAIYRQMAASEKPNYLEAALTGKGATRNLELPFQQALKLLNEEKDRNASLQRTRMQQGAGGLSVTERQGLRMEDSILARDVDIISANIRENERDINKYKEAIVRDRGNDELMKLHKANLDQALKQRDIYNQQLQQAQGQRRQITAQMAPGKTSASSSSAPVSGVPDPGFLPTNGDITTPSPESSQVELLPQVNQEGQIIPFGPNGEVAQAPVTPESGFIQQQSRALRKEVERVAVKLAGNNDAIAKLNNARSLSEVQKIEKENEDKIASFQSADEARAAGDKSAPDGFVALGVPNAKGDAYTYRYVKKPDSMTINSSGEWTRGENVYYKGEGGVMYMRKFNQPPSMGKMVTKKDGSAVTPAELLSMWEEMAKAKAAGVYHGELPIMQNPTVKQQAQLPLMLRTPDTTNPNTQETKKSAVENNMSGWLKQR